MKHGRANCRELILGERVKIAETAEISGGRIEIGDDVRIGENVRIEVTEHLMLGKGSIVGPETIIRGRDVALGRESYTNHHAEIGGGSCFEPTSRLRTGYWCHIGSYAIINTAMPVDIGNEVGLGRFTNIYTHGAYLSTLEGFSVEFGPVSIGHRVWLPSATVNPNVTIGDDVVVGVGSVVTKDLPGGCLALGVPCRVVKENAYPVRLTPAEKLDRVSKALRTWEVEFRVVDASVPIVEAGGAHFDFGAMTVHGSVSEASENARNYMRRHGVRFKVETASGRYEPWKE